MGPSTKVPCVLLREISESFQSSPSHHFPLNDEFIFCYRQKQTLELSQFPGEIFCKKSVNENETT